MNLEKYIKALKTKLKDHPKRFEHSIRVYEMALELASIYKIDKNKVGLAAIFHDYSKYDSIDEQIKYLSNEEIENYKKTPVIYHALSAAYILENEFNVKDIDVINAIKYHVWGHVEMGMVEKIVLISDKIERGRTYPKVDEFREIAFSNLDLAIYEFLNDNIKYINSKGFVIHNEQKEVILMLKEAIESGKY